MKPGFRALSALALASCILAAVFTVEAQKKSRKRDAGPASPAPTQDIKSPTRSPQPKAIGSCNSLKGCAALNAASESKDVGGAFKPCKIDGGAGV